MQLCNLNGPYTEVFRFSVSSTYINTQLNDQATEMSTITAINVVHKAAV
jgi:hypothetical protein